MRRYTIEGEPMKRDLIENERGQALIFITLAFVILGMFIGFAVDGGRGYLMRERLRKIVDAAALAGAKALAAVPEGGDAFAAARDAACDSAAVNGLDKEQCGDAGKSIVVELAELENPDKSTQQGVVVTGTDKARTFFMALGALIGCETCKEINVVASGRAVPDTLADIVLVLDDTGTMSCEPGSTSAESCAIEGAKAGANTLVDMLLKGSSTSAKLAYVPFRGCVKSDGNSPDVLRAAWLGQGFTNAQIDAFGCISPTEMVDLTNDATRVQDQIKNRVGQKGFPGTNICLAMVEGEKKLFDSKNAREIARKVMVILTDGSQNYSDSADGGPAPGGIPNLGNPTPTPYPKGKYLQGVGDGGLDSDPSCMAKVDEPGHPAERWGGGGEPFNKAIAELDRKANNVATTLKKSKNVEIYVLRFTRSTKGDNLATGDPAGSCSPSLIGALGVQRGGRNTVYDDEAASNDDRDKNLARCLASNTAMGDPGAEKSNDHYFFAATPAAITAQFIAIAQDILKKRRLVG